MTAIKIYFTLYSCLLLFTGCGTYGNVAGSGNREGVILPLPVDVSFYFEKDTVNYGDKINVFIRWRNTSDSTVTFHSSAKLLFAQPEDSREVYYGPQPPYFVMEKELGNSRTLTLQSGSSYDQKLTVAVKPSSFTEKATPYRLTVWTGIRKGEQGNIFTSSNDSYITILRPKKR